MRYRVTVSNIGVVYQGDDGAIAKQIYDEYKQQSSDGYGRAANEDVELFDNDVPVLAFMGSESDED